jgi:tRNA (guanine-N7-)-methyltransferase
VVDGELGVPFPGPVLPPERWTSTLWRDDGRAFDWTRVFGRGAPHIVDIGCGTGRFLLGSALARPDCDHLGIELVKPLLERAARRADQRGLANVRFVAGDAVAWLFTRLEPGSVDEIHIYHPQPYYDPAEVHLGMLTAAFLERAWLVARPGGILILQTDNRAYGRYLLEAARKHFDPELLQGPWPDAPEGRTRREIVARRKGLPVLRVVARRRETPLGIAPPPPYFDPDRPGLRKRRKSRRA